MKCPRCGSTEKISGVSYPGARDVISYQLNCGVCGVNWKAQKGIRFMEGRARKKQKKEWANVEIKPNRMQRMIKERSMKVDRGECPQCGGNLITVVDKKRSCERLVGYNTTCDGCDWKAEGTADRKHWEAKQSVS